MKKLLYLIMLVSGLFLASCEDHSEIIEVIDIATATDGGEDDDDSVGTSG